jgi:hypothetical protein
MTGLETNPVREKSMNSYLNEVCLFIRALDTLSRTLQKSLAPFLKKIKKIF